ncbi:hypothetical protein SB773_32850, partial [Bacillus sp. SIMBA_074]|uniref:hypothetical protein n=1 Tax=Bacillus sp. SIMBA_074 TaxID=3085812 RepID=UPI00397B6FCE
AAPNDLTADLLIGGGVEPTVSRAALDTMRDAGVRPGEPVMLAGRSSGKPIVTYALLAVTSFIGLLQLIPGIGQAITGQLLFAAGY